MGPPESLYRVRVSSSGLIYAVIVGAWAAYLVPMWLRRQDELNEARPTERFSTAIRLLSGKAAMERRYAKGSERREGEVPEDRGDLAVLEPDGDDAHGSAPDAAEDAVDVRAFADPRTMVGERSAAAPTEILPRFRGAADRDQSARDEDGQAGADGADARQDDDAAQGDARQGAAERNKARQNNKRAKALARRRRTTMLLFVAFTLGALVAAVGGLAFLWVPVVPGALLSAYIVHLRVQERRRFSVTMDRRRAEAAAQRLHERRPRRPGAAVQGAEDEHGPEQAHAQEPVRTAPPEEEPAAADRRALVEQTDHAEWVDQQRHGDHEQAGWDPVPVPLPTYVSAPVAPRTARGVDLEAPDAWSSARSSTAGDEPAAAAQAEEDEPPARPRRGRNRSRTPLFDQYEGEDRPRAANE